MAESTWIPIRKRIFSHEELCSDSSIRPIGFLDYQNWGKTHSWYQAVNRMPISAPERLTIKDILLRPTYFASYELEDPWIITGRWPHDELKYFLITAEGNLVDPAENVIWDRRFPFLSRFDGGELSGMSIPASVSDLPSTKWIWHPSAANFTHFFFDVFVQLAMAQDHLSKEYLSGFDLPLCEDVPAWQEELLQKLSLRRIIPPGANKSNQFNIFRVKKILLPIVSQRALALDWLRGFLAKSFQDSHSQDLSSKHGKLIMVTRRDARRARIQNISAIEEIVVKFGGSLIDASTLSCAEKLATFRNCSISIAESSGCMNSALFAPEHSQIIALTDPSVFSKDFIVGAWPYFSGYAPRAHFIVGGNGAHLPGSPVGSSSYSLEAIKHYIVEAL